MSGLGGGWYLRTLTARKERALLEERLRLAEERQKFYEEFSEKINQNLKLMVNEVLKENTSYFLKFTREIFQEKERALASLTRPLEENLATLKEEINRLERRREKAYGQLEEKLRTLVQEHLPRLEEETRLLKRLFEIPQSRGQWGEIQLKRLIELAGLLEHCDFAPQAVLKDGTRPDLVVYLPGKRLIIIDAKAPLPNGEEGFAKTLKRHIDALARKAYWEAANATSLKSPAFVVLFLPAESLLAQAYAEDQSLLEYAAAKRIILATPLTLLSMLKAVALSWREEAFLKNTEEIIRTGQDLYHRLRIFARHLSTLGRNLERSVDQFNQTVTSFKKRLLPAAKRFEDFKISADRIEPPKEIEPPEEHNKLDL